MFHEIFGLGGIRLVDDSAFIGIGMVPLDTAARNLRAEVGHERTLRIFYLRLAQVDVHKQVLFI
jgi:hypothetical protein